MKTIVNFIEPKFRYSANYSNEYIQERIKRDINQIVNILFNENICKQIEQILITLLPPGHKYRNQIFLESISRKFVILVLTITYDDLLLSDIREEYSNEINEYLLRELVYAISTLNHDKYLETSDSLKRQINIFKPSDVLIYLDFLYRVKLEGTAYLHSFLYFDKNKQKALDINSSLRCIEEKLMNESFIRLKPNEIGSGGVVLLLISMINSTNKDERDVAEAVLLYLLNIDERNIPLNIDFYSKIIEIIFKMNFNIFLIRILTEEFYFQKFKFKKSIIKEYLKKRMYYFYGTFYEKDFKHFIWGNRRDIDTIKLRKLLNDLNSDNE